MDKLHRMIVPRQRMNEETESASRPTLPFKSMRRLFDDLRDLIITGQRQI